MNIEGRASALRRVARTRRLLDELGLTDPLEALEELQRLRARDRQPEGLRPEGSTAKPPEPGDAQRHAPKEEGAPKPEHPIATEVPAPVAHLRSITHPDWLELCERDAPGAFPVYAEVPADARDARYRLLERDEPMHQDDEGLQEDGVTWLRIGWPFAKCKYNPSFFLPIRRRVDAAMSAPTPQEPKP